MCERAGFQQETSLILYEVIYLCSSHFSTLFYFSPLTLVLRSLALLHLSQSLTQALPLSLPCGSLKLQYLASLFLHT